MIRTNAKANIQNAIDNSIADCIERYDYTTLLMMKEESESSGIGSALATDGNKKKIVKAIEDTVTGIIERYSQEIDKGLSTVPLKPRKKEPEEYVEVYDPWHPFHQWHGLVVGVSANEKLPKELKENAKIALSRAAQQLAGRLNDLAGDGIKSTGTIKPPKHKGFMRRIARGLIRRLT